MVNPTVYKYLKDATGQLPKTKVVIDHNDGVSTTVSSSVISTLTERFVFDENTTTYSLFPYELNEPPIIVESLHDASEPKVYGATNWIEGQKAMYINEEGAVIVASGASFKLRVKAQQPESLNTENGIPVTAVNEGVLTYTWFFNGIEIVPSYMDDSVPNFVTDGDTLSIKQINKTQAGAYSCAITNDAGATVTAPLLIQIFDPYATETTIFRKNLVTNPLFADDVSGWTVTAGDVQTLKLPPSDRRTFERVGEMKQVNANEEIGYIPQMFEPQAETVSFPGMKKAEDDTYFSLEQLSTGEGGYMTRGPLMYNAANGRHIAVAYQDIDLSTIQDHIAGKVYGIDGVKAYFSCYLGNSVSRVVPTEAMVTREERSDKANYWEGGPRLSLENILLTGRPHIEESLQVYVQEFGKNELLKSSVYSPKRNAAYTTFEPKLTDPLNEVLWPLPQDQYVTTEDNLITLQTNSHDARMAKTFELLYGDRRNYYTNGQAVRQGELILSKLNAKTDRIRITLKYQLGGGRFFDINSEAVDNGKLLEYISYENAFKKGLLETTGKSILSSIRDKGGSYADAPMTKGYSDGSVPRAMATGFVFTTTPIIPDNTTTTSDIQYKPTVVRVGQQMDFTNRQQFPTDTTSFFEKYLEDYSKFQFMKYELRSQQQPVTEASLPHTSPLDWRDSTQVWKATIDLKRVDKKSKQSYIVPVDTYEPFDAVVVDQTSRDFNTYDFNSILDLTKPRQQKAKFAESTGINLKPIIDDVVQVAPSELATYLTTEYSTSVSPTTFELRKWLQQSYKDSITNVVNDKRDLAQHKTFRVAFNMIHADENGVLKSVGTAVKYMVAGKTINLRFEDFIAEGALESRYGYARKAFTGERGVYVVPISMVQVFKLDTWVADEHLQPIPNLQAKVQAFIDNITWSSYYYVDEQGNTQSQSWKDRIESLTVDASFDFTTSTAIQSLIDVVSTEANYVVPQLDTLVANLVSLKTTEGITPAPQGTVYVESNVDSYTQQTSNTPTQGFIDIAFSKTNDNIYIYDYAIRSIREREL